MSLRSILILVVVAGVCLLPFGVVFFDRDSQPAPIADGRSEVVFWHFWGGQDRDVVEDVVRRFNESQNEYWVRAVAMPGNNLQAKLFLSVAGGDPPDLVNQDDPVLADWAKRGIITPLDSFADKDEVVRVRDWMFDSARRLSTFDNQMYAVCNGLDIRALYYNQTALDAAGQPVPETVEQFDRVIEALSPAGTELRTHYAYLPDSRRLWAWGVVFGGQFIDEATRLPTANATPIVEALRWMQAFGKRYGPDNLAAFRKGAQSLPGKVFPLLPIDSEAQIGRYAMVMDGQWRVRDIKAFVENRQSKGLAYPEFGVTSLPHPAGGRPDAGWVNGNFFVVPSGARNAKGSWAFMKFWIGFSDPSEAVKTNIAGGWIPVSKSVVEQPAFREYLQSEPLFAKFVELAASPNQFPIPQVPGASMFRRTIESAGYEAIETPERSPSQILDDANERIRAQLQRSGERQ